MKKYGNRQAVFDGLSKMTRGGLTKEDLIMSRGKLVSKRKSEQAKVSYSKYGFKKREPEPEPKEPKKKRRRNKKNVVA